MNCERISNALIPYMDGRANITERREVEAHLAVCDACRARVEEYRKLWNVLDEVPATEPSFGFDARLRARIAAEPRRNWFGWLVPSPRLAFATALLVAFSVWMAKLPAEHQETMTSEKQFQMIRDLRVLENYEVLSNFEALSELPVTDQVPQQPGQQQPEQDTGTL
jgi:anti-sigma factor RsiW